MSGVSSRYLISLVWPKIVACWMFCSQGKKTDEVSGSLRKPRQVVAQRFSCSASLESGVESVLAGLLVGTEVISATDPTDVLLHLGEATDIRMTVEM